MHCLSLQKIGQNYFPLTKMQDINTYEHSSEVQIKGPSEAFLWKYNLSKLLIWILEMKSIKKEKIIAYHFRRMEDNYLSG